MKRYVALREMKSDALNAVADTFDGIILRCLEGSYKPGDVVTGPLHTAGRGAIGLKMHFRILERATPDLVPKLTTAYHAQRRADGEIVRAFKRGIWYRVHED